MRFGAHVRRPEDWPPYCAVIIGTYFKIKIHNNSHVRGVGDAAPYYMFRRLPLLFINPYYHMA